MTVSFRHRRVVVFLALGLATAIVAGRLSAQTPGQPAESPPLSVRVERTDGGTVVGTTTLQSFRLKTDFASADVTASRIRSLTLRSEDGEVTAVIELDDRTRLQGKLLNDFLPVQVGDRVVKLVPAEIREVKFPKPKNGSLWAIFIGLLTLAIMEVVLGIDNVIFLVIVADNLPESQRPRARKVGLILALGTRILLLLTLTWLIGLTRPLFTLPRLPFLEAPDARDISVRDLVLFFGGVFLIGKSVKEMHEKVASARHGHAHQNGSAKVASFVKTVVQIAIIDIVFSLDSVITAIGMVEDVWVMIVAMVIAMLVMLAFSSAVADFVGRNPTIKVLALSFLILIGVLLVAEGLGQHMDKGYIYFAMAFAVIIELINMRLRPKTPADADKLA
ncbi:MAG TPA: TerC family protein [Fimbriiglobus sp.]|jgi:predicted tellurium resistance membrane protein TerC